jgi:hypothetical protein
MRRSSYVWYRDLSIDQAELLEVYPQMTGHGPPPQRPPFADYEHRSSSSSSRFTPSGNIIESFSRIFCQSTGGSAISVPSPPAPYGPVVMSMNPAIFHIVS